MSRGEARGLIPDRTRSESRKEGEDTLTRSVSREAWIWDAHSQSDDS